MPRRGAEASVNAAHALQRMETQRYKNFFKGAAGRQAQHKACAPSSRRQQLPRDRTRPSISRRSPSVCFRVSLDACGGRSCWQRSTELVEWAGGAHLDTGVAGEQRQQAAL